jgi:hypothetical protein
MGMTLIPSKPSANKQPMLADRDFTTGHDVTRQTSHLPTVAQHNASLLQTKDSEGGTSECGTDSH